MQATRRCSVDGCDATGRLIRGWCSKHYQRWSKFGDPNTVTVIRLRNGASDEDRFRIHVDDSGGPDACHPWMGARLRADYGSFHANGHSIQAHRWILGHIRGKHLTGDELALHHCDNPPCVNPRHLYVGDHVQNMRDMIERDRVNNPRAAAFRAQTHCVAGHEYDVKNTYQRPDGGRDCRICKQIAHTRWLARVSPNRGPANAAKTHCKRGHEFTPENTYVDRQGGRECKSCRRAADRRRAPRRSAKDDYGVRARLPRDA